MSSQKNVLEAILGSTRTVFNIQSLRMLTASTDSQKLSKSLHYYVKEGKIRNPRRGIYTKATYDEREMACCLFRPAYISLEYVLQRFGVVFQYDEAITCVSYLNRTVEIDDNILIASPERAFLDMLYLSSGNCYFDNLNSLDKTKVRQLLPCYHSIVLTERTTELLNKR